MIDVVIVGCGQIVTHHCAALGALPPSTFQIVALVDPSDERRQVISKQLRDKSPHMLESPLMECGSLDELLNNEHIMKQKPAVFISVPHDLHVTLAKQALDAGLDVVMEKPLAPTIEGCKELLQHADHIHRREGALQ